MNIVLFDWETGGINPYKGAEPIELAAIALDHDLNEIGRFPARILRVQHPEKLQPEALAVNKKSVEQIMAGENPKKVMYDFVLFCQQMAAKSGETKVIPAAHNIRFDEKFLAWALETYLPEIEYEKIFDYHQICSFNLAYFKKIIVERTRYPEGALDKDGKDIGGKTLKGNLGSLTAYYHIEHRGAHEAMADVEATVEVMRHLRDELLRPELEWVVQNHIAAFGLSPVLEQLETLHYKFAMQGP